MIGKRESTFAISPFPIMKKGIFSTQYHKFQTSHPPWCNIFKETLSYWPQKRKIDLTAGGRTRPPTVSYSLRIITIPIISP